MGAAMKCATDDRSGRGGSALDTSAGTKISVGRGVTLRLVDDGTREIGVVQTVQGDPRNTEVCVATLGFRIVEQGDIDRRWDGLALLRFGVGGTQHQAEIDWRQGCHIAVPCSYLEIGARYSVADASQVLSVECRASLAWGGEPSRNLATRSFGPIAVEPGVSAVFAVPAFAVAAHVGSPAPLPATFAFQQLADPAATTIIDQAFGPELTAAKLTEGVHLHGSARFWRLSNLGAVPVTCWPSFTIGL